MIFITMNGTYTREELEEVLILADEQEKTDRYRNTELHINGDNAEIDVNINGLGDIEYVNKM